MALPSTIGNKIKRFIKLQILLNLTGKKCFLFNDIGGKGAK